jgi:chromosome partitioning protein
MKQVVAIMNNKGGVAKTTSAVNIAACWGEMGKKVLVIDLDPQGSASICLGIVDDGRALLRALLTTSALPILPTKTPGVDLVPSGQVLAESAQRSFGSIGSKLLMQCLACTDGDWDFIIIDCSPSFGVLAMNALQVSSHVVIPVEANFLSYQGLNQMIQAVKAFREENPALAIRGIIPCRAQARRRIHGEFLTMMENLLPGCIGPAVRENVALAEAPSSGLPAVAYWPSSNGAHDYRRVSNWLLERLACAGNSFEREPIGAGLLSCHPSQILPTDQNLLGSPI